MNIIHGSLDVFHCEEPGKFIKYWYELTQAQNIYICNGSEEEKKELIDILLKQKTIVKLNRYKECYLARTNPLDVARLESRTFICTDIMKESVTIPRVGCHDHIGQWMDPMEMRGKLLKLFNGCMKGRTLYVIPFCMGQLGSSLAKTGIEITDSPYVVVCMGIMTIMGTSVLPYINNDFVRCVHSVGLPLPLRSDAPEIDYKWPCNPENTYITHFPDAREIISIGSGYGGNSLLGKKSLALRLASAIAKKEGWMAEHMLIMSLENPEGKKINIAAAFPSACGKTNLAMLTPTLPGWKVTCLGDDIAWMKYDEDGFLRAINPEHGFFGVCPGTNHKSNPIAMEIVSKNTIFTNVCETSDGGVFWEGLESEIDTINLKFIDWQGQDWNLDSKTKSSHPNSRFCSPITNCPILDDDWDNPRGVVISAIIFGGRRPHGIPLVFQSKNWTHGVLVGSCVKSETTSAASDLKANTVLHDPFSMRPFVGYNCGDYMKHWLEMGEKPGRHIPLIFHVNWFLKDQSGNFVWPGFGENSRVLQWIFDRCHGVDNFIESPIGFLPRRENFNLENLPGVNFTKLFHIDKDFWVKELAESRNFFENVINEEFPKQLDKVLKTVQLDVEMM